jgi:class 3 adenylate cyclase
VKISTQGNRIKKLSRFESPHSVKVLSKHIDPFLLRDLVKIQIDTIKGIHLTVVFWDITGFSQMCKDLNDYPEAIMYFLKNYFEMAIKIIRKHNGVLDKFIGDGILAYFGYNNSNLHGDPHNAINAALELKNKFIRFKKRYIQYCNKQNGKELPNINIRCGMHNGQAFLHYFSSNDRDSIVILGSTVNLASRLEGLAEEDEIITSKQLRNMVKNRFLLHGIKIEQRINEKDQKGKAHNGKIKTFEEEIFVYAVKGKKKRNTKKSF